jgi:5-aminolevulinate synthase
MSVCDPVLCKQISDVLIDRRPDADIEHLMQALAEIWAGLGLAKAA